MEGSVMKKEMRTVGDDDDDEYEYSKFKHNDDIAYRIAFMQ